MREGYVLIADILGFGSIISNLKEQELELRIDEWINLVSDLSKKHNIENFQLLSDTLFISIEGNEKKSLKKLIEFSKDLLSTGLQIQIPIKGAIFFGKHFWGTLTYGKPIISAHRLEISQNWIGIIIDDNVPNYKDYWSTDDLICYAVPMKKGQIKLRPAIVWGDINFQDLTKNTLARGLSKEGEILTYSWAEKIRNTYEFFIYVKMLRKNGENGKNFRGFLPIETIGLNI